MAVLIQRIIDNRANLEPPIPQKYDPIFGNNTWEQISEASTNNEIPNTWNIGDEIELQLSGTYNNTITLQIWDFDHFTKTDGSGKAGILLGCKDIPFTARMYTSSTLPSNARGNKITKTDLYNTTLPNVLNSFPANLKNLVVSVNDVEYLNAQDKATHVGTSFDIFIPSVSELGITISNMSSDGKVIEIFKDDGNRYSAGMSPYWTRTPQRLQRYNYYYISSDNTTGASSCPGNNIRGVRFCFNI